MLKEIKQIKPFEYLTIDKVELMTNEMKENQQRNIQKSKNEKLQLIRSIGKKQIKDNQIILTTINIPKRESSNEISHESSWGDLL